MCAGCTGACLACEIMGLGWQYGTAQPLFSSIKGHLVSPCPNLVLELMA